MQDWTLRRHIGGLLCLLSVAAGAWSQRAVELNNLGIESYNAGRPQEAIGYFERAYENARDNATVRRNLCNAYQAYANELAQAGNYTQAVKPLELAIGVDPENYSPLVQLGSYYLRLNMVPDAIFRLEEAIELKPGELNAHELLGEAYYRDNDMPSARAQWEYVLQMDPGRKDLRERYEKASREESVEGDFNRSGSRHFKISYPKGVSSQVRARILNTLESAYWEIGRKMGGGYPPAPIQVIIYGADQFSEATQLDANVGAVYDGKIRAPINDSTGQILDSDELKRRLKHEYVHVVVRHLVSDKAPWWLNEGLAETFSRDVDSTESALLQRMYREGVEFRLADLEAHQLKILDADTLRLAYAQSHATVQALWTRYGQRGLKQMMSNLAAGMKPEDALIQSYRRTYSVLEAEVANAYR